MTEDRIRDLPKHRKALEEADAMIALSKIAKAVSPLLPKTARNGLAKADPAELSKVRKEMEHLANLPDRFNAQFADRGWVMFGEMNAEVATKTVALAEED